MSCQIKRKYDGSIKGVYAPNGNESILYSNIVDNVSIEDMSSDPYVQSIMDKGLIADASVKELALALWSKAYTPEFIESFGNWKEDKLPNTDVNGEPLYSALTNGIKSVGDNNNLTYQFIAVNKILDNIDKVKRWDKQIKDRNAFWNKIQQDLKISKSQIDLLKEVSGRTIEEKLVSFVAEYGYVIKIETAKGKNDIAPEYDNEYDEYYAGEKKGENTQYYANLTVPGGIEYTENEISTPNITPSIKGHAAFSTDSGIGWFRSDEQLGGKNYKKSTNGNEYSFSIKNKGDFDSNYIWNEDTQTATFKPRGNYGNSVLITKEEFNNAYKKTFGKDFSTNNNTRRILEVQSDWGQKQRKSSEPDINVKYDIQQIINDLQKSGDLKIDCN